MHEMSLAEGVLQLMEDAAASQGFSRVKTVWLEIGQLAAVRDRSHAFLFRCGHARQSRRGCQAGDRRSAGAGLVHEVRGDGADVGTIRRMPTMWQLSGAGDRRDGNAG